jgi:hypothetical protein
MSKLKTCRVYPRVTDETFEKLCFVARRRGTNLATIAREALDLFLASKMPKLAANLPSDRENPAV